MGIPEIVLLVIGGVLLLFLLVVLIRTLAFRPKGEESMTFEEITVDRDRAVESLRQLVMCKTVSYRDAALEDEAEFERLLALLPQLFPRVHATCSLTRLPDRGLLYRFVGREAGDPAVLMAHYDVVPAEEENWEKPPFGGVLEDGVLWGRGTLDTKVTMNAVLSSAEHLIERGFVPQHDIYFAFSGCEEISGAGAQHIVEYFREKGITPALVLDEGGAVVADVFPGVKEPCGLIGIAEKGMMDLEYAIKSNGGHASAPKPHTPVGELSAAAVAVENHPFPRHMTKPVAEMFDTLGRHSTFLYRMIFANLWCFSPLLDVICRKSGGELNALMRTTVAFTQMQGSTAANVIPPSASMVSNIRLNPEDSVKSAEAYLRRRIKNDRISLRPLLRIEPSRISRTDVPGWHKITAAVRGTWRGALVAPYLMMQCSDSRHYGVISDRVYRFSAMDLTAEERRTIHGNNERIRVETVGRSVEFYVRLMKDC